MAQDQNEDRVGHYGQWTIDGETVNVCNGGEWVPTPDDAPTCPRCQETFRAGLRGLKER